MNTVVKLPGFLMGRILPLGLLALLGGSRLLAEEGMWTFDNPPLTLLKEKYHFNPTQEWLDHVRLSSVRFNDGGSGSFVGPGGLVLTNHHVASGQLQKISSPKKDYAKDGFYARTQAEELKCPDLELNVLTSMEDVTRRVQGAVEKETDEQAALRSRKAEIAKIEKESLDSTGLRSDVVSLYQGGEYWLYRYKKYTDVRMVFAPEQQIAFFGGDPDNFTFPRYNLDMALFRVYENGKPVRPQHYLKWNRKGAAEGELVFVSGHPGTTSRLNTVTQLEMERDDRLPLIMKTLKRRLEALKRYSSLGTEQSREAAQMIFGIENALKAETGMLQGLSNEKVITQKKGEESDFRRMVASKPEWKEKYGPAWSAVARAVKKQRGILKPAFFRRLGGSRMAARALAIVQYVAEVKKPDGERLDGFHEAELESLRFRLFSPAPVYPHLEETLLADALQESLEELGPEDPFIKTVLEGRPPADVAKNLITGTRLADPAFRKSLVEGGEAEVEASTDPLIIAARKVDPLDREMHKWLEDNVESVETSAGEKIGEARFAAYGKSLYPDATFTLRLTYGTVEGYPMNGTRAPSWTTLYGLYDRAYGFDQKPPFDLPARYRDSQRKVDLSTPFNFVTTCDIVGGNSGSPVVNREGELVGLIFDGNIESLVGDFVYFQDNNRTVAVHSAVMIELLRKLYDAGTLADELEGKVPPLKKS